MQSAALQLLLYLEIWIAVCSAHFSALMGSSRAGAESCPKAFTILAIGTCRIRLRTSGYQSWNWLLHRTPVLL